MTNSPESNSPESNAAPSIRKRRSSAAEKRRRADVEARALILAALARGDSHCEIADRHGVDVTTVRRIVSKALEDRPPLSTRDHAAIQIARLERAVKAFDFALLEGDWRAAAAFPRVVQALDRYHGFVEASGEAEAQLRRLRAPETAPALPPPPPQLTSALGKNAGAGATAQPPG